MRFSRSLLALAATLVHAELVVKDGKVALLNSVGITTHSNEFTSSSPAPLPHSTVASGDVLRLSFLVQDEQGEAVQPQQAMISWQPTHQQEKNQAGRDFMQAVKMRKGGKGRLELDFARASPFLLSLSQSHPISATLLIGDAKHNAALKIALGTFTLSESLSLPFPYPPDADLPKSWEIETYSDMPEMEWTFKAKEKSVKLPIALIGVLFVLSPWIVFAGALSHIKLQFSSPSVDVSLFLASFTALEGLIFLYWIRLKLIPTLPYFFGLAFLTAWTGRRALGDLRVRRLKGAKKTE